MSPKGLVKKIVHYVDKDLLRSISMTDVAGRAISNSRIVKTQRTTVKAIDVDDLITSLK